MWNDIKVQGSQGCHSNVKAILFFSKFSFTENIIE